MMAKKGRESQSRTMMRWATSVLLMGDLGNRDDLRTDEPKGGQRTMHSQIVWCADHALRGPVACAGPLRASWPGHTERWS